MQTLEYDHAVHESPNAGDDSLMVKFFIDKEQDHDASEKAGHIVYKDSEWIDIRIPGSKDNVVCRPIRETDKSRFPRHYAAFKQRMDKESETVIGMPLSMWPEVTPAQAENLKHFNIRTVEQLAGTPDSAGQSLMGFNGLKNKAQEFMKITKNNAPIKKLQGELDAAKKLNLDMAARIKTLEDKLIEK
jgi:hypothetical protein